MTCLCGCCGVTRYSSLVTRDSPLPPLSRSLTLSYTLSLWRGGGITPLSLAARSAHQYDTRITKLQVGQQPRKTPQMLQGGPVRQGMNEALLPQARPGSNAFRHGTQWGEKHYQLPLSEPTSCNLVNNPSFQYRARAALRALANRAATVRISSVRYMGPSTTQLLSCLYSIIGLRTVSQLPSFMVSPPGGL